MSTSPSLLIDLAGVARLAGVQRPVASVWRSRFASTPDPFPAPVTERDGQPQFDAERVAEWLSNTGHGNNPEARADAAAEATPADFSFHDANAVAELEALIALSSQVESLTGCPLATLREAAAEADPHDELLRSEVASHLKRGAPWLSYAERLIDAAYSPSAALALVARRFAASRRTAGSAGPLVDEVVALVVETVRGLTVDSDSSVTLDPCDAELSSALAADLGDEVALLLPAGVDARRVRRRLLADGQWLADSSESELRSVVVRRVPAGRGDDVSAMLRAADEASLAMRDTDVAVVIGPARALTDALAPVEAQLRADVLRSGRVRSIARLAPGLVDSASRESLVIWVLGTPAETVPVERRFTAVADLADVALTPVTRADLVSDFVASVGSGRDLAAHSFRFSRLVNTSSLQARNDSLIVSSAGQRPRPVASVSELPARLAMAGDAVRGDIAPIRHTAASVDIPRAEPEPVPVSAFIAGGLLRVLSGTRLSGELVGESGLVVVTASDLDEPARIGERRVDQLVFAARHPGAALTRPGDVIFRTSPTAAAWVDVEGSKVVAYPARVLRITADDSCGLVPEIVAADITGAATGPGAWKRWRLRRVSTPSAAPLRRALANIAAVRAELQGRIARLDDYAALLVAGATSGAVILTDSTTAGTPAPTH